MLTQLEVFTPGITVPPWPIVDQSVKQDAIQIKKITGLGPVLANVNTTGYGSIDGEFLTGTFTPKRNIVITVGLNPDWSTQTLEGLRQVLYSYFMPENQVRLRFTSTHIDQVEIIGVVESCELDMFSQDPEYQISIICPQPNFTAVSATVLTGLTQAFATPVDVPIEYEGSVDSGFVVDITLPTGGSAFSGEVRILNSTPNLKIAFISAVSVSSTVYFSMSSVQNDKYIRSYTLPGGVPTSILGSLLTGSSWITLRKGTNKIQILTATAGLHWALSYYAKYGGL